MSEPVSTRWAPWMSLASRVTAAPVPVLGAVAALTLALVVPLLAMAPTETASQSPDTAVTRAQAVVDDVFASPIHTLPLVVEATDGNILSRTSLLALRNRDQALRADPTTGFLLVARYRPELEAEAVGVRTIAEAVDEVLIARGLSLDAAADAVVAEVVTALVAARGPQAWGLAHQAYQDSTGAWSAPALLVAVEADNAGLGGGGNVVTIGGGDHPKEEFARRVQAVYRETPDLRTWAVAADVNLTSQEQGTRAGPYIGLTVFAVLAIVLLVHRSYWLTAATGLAVCALMIWLGGLSNLLGLKDDQVLATIVPIAMIAFGIDSTFHIYGRYREEDDGRPGRLGVLAIGLGAVLAPVLLALASDSAAFLSNLVSPIESVRQFGLAAAVASVSGFLLLGLAAPLGAVTVEQRLGRSSLAPEGRTLAELGAGLAAAVGATLAVLVVVYLSTIGGVVLIVLYGATALAWPIWVALGPGPAADPAPDGGVGWAAPDPREVLGGDAPEPREEVAVSGWARSGGDGPPDPEVTGRFRAVAGLPRERGPGRSRGADAVQVVAARCAARPEVTIGVAAFCTGIALFHALSAEASFRVTDFFAPDVDFVVALDKATLYAGDQAGEEAVYLVETDLAEPSTLAATAGFVDEVRSSATGLLARDDAGVIVDGGAVDLVRQAMDPAAVVPGSQLTWRVDGNGDGLPDTRADIEALLADVAGGGITDADGRELWPAPLVPTVLGATPDGALSTRLVVQVPGTSDQATVRALRDAAEPGAAVLAQRLDAVAPGSRVTVTGSPVFRDEQLRAIIASLLQSLPIAVALCVALVTAFTRSVRLAVLATIPVLLVVVWLYGFLRIAGYGINVVTATIGAISIGVGIDYATHMTMRLVDEYRRWGSHEEALAAAVRGTGTALAGSASTSVAGFGILALAPMPLFASYGLLTAMMIVFSLVASIVVLPSLLLLFGELTPMGEGAAVAPTPVRDLLPSAPAPGSARRGAPGREPAPPARPPSAAPGAGNGIPSWPRFVPDPDGPTPAPAAWSDDGRSDEVAWVGDGRSEGDAWPDDGRSDEVAWVGDGRSEGDAWSDDGRSEGDAWVGDDGWSERVRRSGGGWFDDDEEEGEEGDWIGPAVTSELSGSRVPPPTPAGGIRVIGPFPPPNRPPSRDESPPPDADEEKPETWR